MFLATGETKLYRLSNNDVDDKYVDNDKDNDKYVVDDDDDDYFIPIIIIWSVLLFFLATGETKLYTLSDDDDDDNDDDNNDDNDDNDDVGYEDDNCIPILIIWSVLLLFLAIGETKLYRLSDSNWHAIGGTV